jgi:hypothetical protein
MVGCCSLGSAAFVDFARPPRQTAAAALYSAVLRGRPWPVPCVRATSPVAEAQRSLKTEQRALCGPFGSADCLSPIRSARQRAERSDLPVMPVIEFVYPMARQAWQLFVSKFHGEFDPGSGRTLAACLTHASGATNQGLPWGKAANG